MTRDKDGRWRGSVSRWPYATQPQAEAAEEIAIELRDARRAAEASREAALLAEVQAKGFSTIAAWQDAENSQFYVDKPWCLSGPWLE